MEGALQKGDVFMKKNFLVASLAVVLAFSLASKADIIQITGVDNGTVATISENGSSSGLGGPSYTGGVYTGLYNAVDLTTGQAWLTYCIDPIGDINIGNQWNANLTTGAQLANGYSGILDNQSYTGIANQTSPNQIVIEKYEMLSYLADNYYYNTSSSNPMVNTSNTSTATGDRSELSLAFWEISRDFDGTAGSLNLGTGNFQATSGDNSYAKSLLSSAYLSLGQSGASNIDLSVFTPTQRPSQEFIALKVPEPGLLSLLGMSLLGLFGLVSFRRKK
jgi:hypothetical protein